LSVHRKSPSKQKEICDVEEIFLKENGFLSLQDLEKNIADMIDPKLLSIAEEIMKNQ